MTEQELKAYIQRAFPKENEANEWKDYSNLKHVIKGHEGDDIISYMSAIANMEGGHLVLGVEDKTLEIRGIQEFHIYTKDNLKKYLLDNCTNLPSEGLSVDEFVTEDTGKVVWVINVPKHMMKLPVYAHNKAWQRVADSLEEMGRSRLDAILNESVSAYDWSAEIVEGATLDDLDPEAIRVARVKYKELYPKKAKEVDSWDDAKFLNKAHLTAQGRITNATMIILGREECESMISPAVCKIRWQLKDGVMRIRISGFFRCQ